MKPCDAFIVGTRHVTMNELRGSGETGCRPGANISTDISIRSTMPCSAKVRSGTALSSSLYSMSPVFGVSVFDLPSSLLRVFFQLP
jgi:hypothetical protein